MHMYTPTTLKKKTVFVIFCRAGTYNFTLKLTRRQGRPDQMQNAFFFYPSPLKEVASHKQEWTKLCALCNEGQLRASYSLDANMFRVLETPLV